jgi:hypothetical protein
VRLGLGGLFMMEMAFGQGASKDQQMRSSALDDLVIGVPFLFKSSKEG